MAEILDFLYSTVEIHTKTRSDFPYSNQESVIIESVQCVKILLRKRQSICNSALVFFHILWKKMYNCVQNDIGLEYRILR
jgi:hypothetical protein